MTQRVASLRAALPTEIQLSYAVKANPMPAVVQHLGRLVDSFDVASAFEMSIALDTVISPDHISFAGPGKTTPDLRRAVAAGVMIEVESKGEVARLAKIGDEVGTQPLVAVRVNPDFAVKGSGMRMGGGPQQFGIDAESVPDVLADILDADLDVVGFHVFAGSQNLNGDLLAQAHRRTADLIIRLAESTQFEVRYVNLGGGLGIPYSAKDSPLDLKPLGENLAEIVSERLGPRLPAARIVIELGRYIVGECGVYVTRIIDRKVSRGETFLVVDGGMHHQLAASGNLGQVIRRNYPLAVANRIDEPRSEVVTIVGCLCTPSICWAIESRSRVQTSATSS